MNGKDMKEESDGKEWEEISLPKALSVYRNETHVVHCMVWFRTSSDAKRHHMSYAFLQLRFDGLLGFPGGVVDEDITSIESIVDALQREMHEEINFCQTIETNDYFYTYYNNRKHFVSHFFAKQISLKEAEQLEESHTKARDFPTESLGLFRIPIGCSYDRSSSHLRRFMHNFMGQKFSGNVRKQLIDVCLKHKIMSQSDLQWIGSQL